MAWTTPATYTDPNVLTAAMLNAYRDNLLALRNGNEHYCRLYMDGNPSFANSVATGTTMDWDQALFQVGSIWTLTPNPDRLTAPVTGKYLFLAVLEWRSNTANLRNVIFQLKSSTGTLIRQYDGQSQGSSGGRSNVCGKLVLQMTAGQFIQVRAFQSSGGALTLHGGAPDRTRVSVLFLGT